MVISVSPNPAKVRADLYAAKPRIDAWIASGNQGAAYAELYRITGSIGFLLTGQVATGSGVVGGVAYAANIALQALGLPRTIAEISRTVAVNEVRDFYRILETTSGSVDWSFADSITSAQKTWIRLGVGDFFPGQALNDVYKLGGQGSVSSVLSGLQGHWNLYGGSRLDFSGDPRYVHSQYQAGNGTWVDVYTKVGSDFVEYIGVRADNSTLSPDPRDLGHSLLFADPEFLQPIYATSLGLMVPGSLDDLAMLAYLKARRAQSRNGRLLTNANNLDEDYFPRRGLISEGPENDGIRLVSLNAGSLRSYAGDSFSWVQSAPQGVVRGGYVWDFSVSDGPRMAANEAPSQIFSGRKVWRSDASIRQSLTWTSNVDPNTGQATRLAQVETIDLTDRSVPSVQRQSYSFGQLGSTLGSNFAKLVETDSVWEGLAVGSLLGTIGLNLGQEIDRAGLLSQRALVAAVDEAVVGFRDFDLDLAAAGLGAVSSYLLAELVSSMGIDGIAGEVVNTLGGAAIGQIADNLVRGVAAFNNVNPAMLANAAGSWLGTYLARQVVQFDTVTGQIGASIGGAVGGTAAAIWAGAQFGAWAGPIGAAVGAFLGYIAGGTIGTLLSGGKPKSQATVTWDAATGEFFVSNVHSKRGGSEEGARALAHNVAQSLNGVLAATGSVLIDADQVAGGQYGMRGSEFVDWTGKFRSTKADSVVEHGLSVALSNLKDRLVGGDVYAKRALSANLAQNSGNLAIESVLGDLAVAKSYGEYMANPAMINALMAAEPDSAFTAGWTLTLHQAGVLQLGKRAASDWLGGYTAFLDESPDGVIDGRTKSAANLLMDLDSVGERNFLVLDGDGALSLVLGDTIETGEKVRVNGGEGSDSILLTRGTDGKDQVYVNGVATIQVSVAATIEGGAGVDTIRGGDLGNDLLGDGGDDRLTGGKLDDWIFGGDGADHLFSQVNYVGSGSDDTTLSNGDYLDGGAGDDWVVGGAGSQWLAGGDGADRIEGGSGADIIQLGAGNDAGGTFGFGGFGGRGADQYVFNRGDGQDVIFDSPEGLTTPTTTSDRAQVTVANINAGLWSRDWAGTSAALYLEADGDFRGGEDAVSFGAGISAQDVIMTRSGSDLIITLAALRADAPSTGVGAGTASGDQLTIRNWYNTSNRVEWLRFADGQDIRIGDLVTFTVGTPGSDQLTGTTAADYLYGGEGDDELHGREGDDIVVGGTGNDQVYGDEDNDWAIGGQGNDLVFGWFGNDAVFGDDGADDVRGEENNDLVVGGRGDDRLEGGSGDDIIRFSRGDGRDVVAEAFQYQVMVTPPPPSPPPPPPTGEPPTQPPTVESVGGQPYPEMQHGQDRLEFGAGITIDDLFFEHSSTGDLLIAVGQDSTFAEAADRLTIAGWHTAASIETFTFLLTGDQKVAGMSLVGGTAAGDTLGAGLGASWITGGLGDDTLSGGALGDILNGGRGRDRLSGGAGDDILYGGDDDDVLDGGDGGDFFIGGDGLDVASYASATTGVQAELSVAPPTPPSDDGQTDNSWQDTRRHGVQDNRTAQNTTSSAIQAATGPAVKDVYDSIEGLEGSNFNDVLRGSDDDNVLRGGMGDDTLSGLLGDDAYEFAAGDGVDTIQDTGGLDSIEFGPGISLADLAFAWEGGGNLRITYGASAILIEGQSTTDNQVETLEFNDGLIVNLPGLLLDGSVSTSGADFMVGTDGNNWHAGGEGDDVISAGTGNDVLYGEAGADILEGGSGSDLLDGGAGLEDTIRYTSSSSAVDVQLTRRIQLGGDAQGDEVLWIENVTGSEHNDHLVGDAGANTLVGLGGHDLMGGHEGDDVLNGDLGDDVVYGDAGDDALHGGLGHDVLRGGVGADKLFGGDGNDTLHGEAGVNVLAGEGGEDTLHGDIDSDVMSGGADADVLNGNGSNDQLAGDGGNDVLRGGAGADVLIGGEGADTLEGGEGYDTYVFDLLSGSDLVVDSGSNRVVLGGAEADKVWITRSGADLVIQIIGSPRRILIQGGAGNVRQIVAGTQSLLVTGAGPLIDRMTAIGAPPLTPPADVLELIAAAWVLGDVQGGDGAETLDGTEIEDGIKGGGGDDLVRAHQADDQVSGEAGHDRLFGGDGDDAIQGGDGDDQLHGEEGKDKLSGNAGNDLLSGGMGVDTLDGGEGFDSVSFADWSAPVVVNLLANATWDQFVEDKLISIENAVGSAFADQLWGDAASNRLEGGSGDDHITGGGGTDKLEGQDGDDRIGGQEGDDHVLGGAGRDTLFGDAGGDLIEGGAGADELHGQDGDDRIGGQDSDDHVLGGSGRDFLFGDAGGDLIEGGLDADELHGQDGDDRIGGQEGDDHVLGGAGRDLLFGDAGSDLIEAGVDADELYGQDGDDRMGGQDGNDLVVGGAGHDQLFGDHGDDHLHGGEGDDLLDGGAGYDYARYDGATSGVTVNLGSSGPQNTGGAGVDTLVSISAVIGSGFADVITGGAEGEELVGGGGLDQIAGGAGHDQLFGGDGDDHLLGSEGDDLLDGGAGYDYARYDGATSGVTVNLGVTGPQNTGGAGVDTLVSISAVIGSGFADVITGGAEGEELVGGGGSDQIAGGAGHDHLHGGEGDDLLDGGVGYDYARYDGATSGVTVNLGLSGPQNTGGAGVDTLVSISAVVGSAFADEITGNLEGNDLSGGVGGDVISGMGGNDVITAGDGHDHLYGGEGDDLLDGGEGYDYARYDFATSGVIVYLGPSGPQYTGGAGVDTLISISAVVGSAFADEITGNLEGNDLYGGAGGDVISGMGGNDVITAGDGHDHLYGGEGDDILDGGEGFDYVRYDFASVGVTVNLGLSGLQNTGGAGVDTLISISAVVGSAFADSILGGLGGEELIGGAGADQISGGAGNDALVGGAGDDLLDGGTGYDIIHLDSASCFDRLRGYEAGWDTIAYGDVSNRYLWFSRSGDNLVIDAIGSASSLTVVDWFISTTAEEKTQLSIQNEGVFRVANASALVTLMSGSIRPADRAGMDLLLTEPGFASSWTQSWPGSASSQAVSIGDTSERTIALLDTVVAAAPGEATPAPASQAEAQVEGLREQPPATWSNAQRSWSGSDLFLVPISETEAGGMVADAEVEPARREFSAELVLQADVPRVPNSLSSPASNFAPASSWASVRQQWEADHPFQQPSAPRGTAPAGSGGAMPEPLKPSAPPAGAVASSSATPVTSIGELLRAAWAGSSPLARSPQAEASPRAAEGGSVTRTVASGVPSPSPSVGASAQAPMAQAPDDRSLTVATAAAAAIPSKEQASSAEAEVTWVRSPRIEPGMLDRALLQRPPEMNDRRISARAQSEDAAMTRRLALAVESMAAFDPAAGAWVEERSTLTRPASSQVMLGVSTRV